MGTLYGVWLKKSDNRHPGLGGTWSCYAGGTAVVLRLVLILLHAGWEMNCILALKKQEDNERAG